MTYSVDIFILRSALSGRDGQRDIAKKTGYFDKTFTFAKASKFKEKEGEESKEMLAIRDIVKCCNSYGVFSNLFDKLKSDREFEKKTLICAVVKVWFQVVFTRYRIHFVSDYFSYQIGVLLTRRRPNPIRDVSFLRSEITPL